MGKLSKDRRDVFYRRAKESGYRARSAYKLIHLNNYFDFLNPKKTRRVVDLCSAPGGWSQVVGNILFSEDADCKKENADNSTQTNTTLDQDKVVIAVDLQKMAPLENVEFIRGDITDQAVVDQIMEKTKGCLVDVVLCDGAPDVTGLQDVDQYIQSQLILAALSITSLILAPGGVFVAKVFRGENVIHTYTQLMTLFDQVYCAKPASSRNSSLEAFVVCQGFKRTSSLHAPNIDETRTFFRDCFKTEKEACSTIPFICCGDLEGMDSDVKYFLSPWSHEYREPVQRPLSAPYLEKDI